MGRRYLRLLVLVAVVAAIAFGVSYRDELSVDALEQWMAGFGAAGPLVFILVYALGAVMFLPGSVLTLAGGALFGPLWGTLYNLTGATLGATVAFFLARYLGSEWVERHSGEGRLKQLKRGVEQEGWRFVAFVRLVPLFPFNALNYALGLTRIKASHYIIATYVCMLPGAIAYTWIGYAGRAAVAEGRGAINTVLIALAIFAVVAFLPRLVSLIRRGPMYEPKQLYDALQSEAPPLVLDVRSPKEFHSETGHIEGALNIPINELEQHKEELLPYQDSPIVTLCHTDKRARKAADKLIREGFSEVMVAGGGIKAWNREGLPVVTERVG